MPVYEWTLPIKLESPNHKSHWAKKYQLDKKHKQLIATFCKDLAKVGLPCEIQLIRMAPRPFDYDNLVASLKGICDKISDMIRPGLAPGRADGDGKIRFIYLQEKNAKNEHHLKIIAQKI